MRVTRAGGCCGSGLAATGAGAAATGTAAGVAAGVTGGATGGFGGDTTVAAAAGGGVTGGGVTTTAGGGAGFSSTGSTTGGITTFGAGGGGVITGLSWTGDATGITTLACTTTAFSCTGGGAVTVAGRAAAIGGPTGGRAGAAGACCCCSFSLIALRTSPGLEIFERSIFCLISGAENLSLEEADPDLAAKYFLSRSASSSSTELEWVFFSVIPTSVRTSKIALLLTSSSLAKSLIRIFIRSVFPPGAIL